MKIKGKAHLLFEQSGVFKNAFKSYGIDAFDYDIQNNFSETDNKVDLFNEIERAYNHLPSIFDAMEKDDIIMAFYPCIYFCESSQCAFRLWHFNYKNRTDAEKIFLILQREEKRHEYYSRLVRLIGVCLKRGLRIILENPWSGVGYLNHNFLDYPQVVDSDRSKRGDHFKKPTAYWFFNCSPAHGETYEKVDAIYKIRETSSAAQAGLCSEERSLISPEYAKNFIANYILGVTPIGGGGGDSGRLIR